MTCSEAIFTISFNCVFLQAIDVRLLLEELVLNVILVADATEDLTMLQAGPPAQEAARTARQRVGCQR